MAPQPETTTLTEPVSAQDHAIEASYSFGAGRAEIPNSLYKLRVEQSSPKKALSLLLRGAQGSTLEKARTLLAGGCLKETESILALALSEAQSSPDQPVQLAETLLVLARLHLTRGNQNEGLKTLAKIRDSDLSPISQITALQCQASALYELGQFDRSLQTIHRAALLVQNQDKAPSILYLRMFEYKNLLKLGISGPAPTLQAFVGPGPYNANDILTYLRLQIDFLRAEQKPIWRESLACVLICRAMGDETYMGLAFLDLLSAVHHESSAIPVIKNFLDVIAHRNERIETERSHANSTSTQNRQKTRKTKLDPAKSSLCSELLTTLEPIHIVINDPGISVKIHSEIQIEELRLTDQQRLTLKHLARMAPRSFRLQEVFARLYPHAKYSSALHSASLRSQISKLRKASRLELHSEKYGYRMPRQLIVPRVSEGETCAQ